MSSAKGDAFTLCANGHQKTQNILYLFAFLYITSKFSETMFSVFVQRTQTSKNTKSRMFVSHFVFFMSVCAGL